MGGCLSAPQTFDSFHLHEMKEAGVDPAVLLESRRRLAAALEASPGLALAVVSKGGETLLQLAAARGKTWAVRALLRAGADTEAADNQGRCALHRAAAVGHADCVTALLRGGANADARAAGAGLTPLHMAAIAANEDVLKALLVGGADSEVRDRRYGKTALLWAAWHGQLPSISYLGSDGRANINARAANGDSVADLAAKRNHGEAICLLAQLGAPAAARARRERRRAPPVHLGKLRAAAA